VDTPVFSRYRALYPTSREKACGFYPRPGQTKDYKIVISCFSTKHTVLRSKCKRFCVVRYMILERASGRLLYHGENKLHSMR
jgi:hypothetical protein